jgi:hypothetical protein
MKVGLVAASLLLVVSGASGCAGGETASQEEFCGAFQDFYDSLAEVGSGEASDYMQKLRAEAEKIDDVGVPEDIPDDAKAGLRLVLDSIADLDDDATLVDLGRLEENYSAEEKEQTAAFQSYLEETCPDLGLTG